MHDCATMGRARHYLLSTIPAMAMMIHCSLSCQIVWDPAGSVVPYQHARRSQIAGVGFVDLRK